MCEKVVFNPKVSQDILFFQKVGFASHLMENVSDHRRDLAD